MVKKKYDIEESKRIIRKLNEAGFEMEIGEKKPSHGIYSGIVGSRRKLLEVRIPKEDNNSKEKENK